MQHSSSIHDFSVKETGYYTQARPEMLRFLPPNVKTLLDVGCGEGQFGALVKEKLRVEVWGIEMDPTAAGHAQKNLDRILVGDAVQLLDTVPDGYFDCIVFNDILEHLVDPQNMLLKTKKKLQPGGVIVASLPNVRYFFTLRDLLIKKQWQYTDSGILDKTHLRFFTRNSIRDMFQSLGFHVLALKGINPITPWKFLLLKILSFGYLADTQYLEYACVARPLHEKTSHDIHNDPS